MLLTCPTCRSGLQVPDETTAMVRCPACKTVFSPAARLAPQEIEPEDEPRKSARGHDRDDDDADEPRRRKEARSENRDFDPANPDDRPRNRRRRMEEDDSLSPEVRASLKAAFARAAWGCKLVTLSLVLFLLSMILVVVFWFQTAFTSATPAYIIAAGVLGAVNWALAAIGVGLCLSGPRSAGHWGYGIAAAVATFVHLALLAVLAGQGKEYSPGMDADPGGPGAKWGLVPTRLDAVTFYMTLILYHDQDLVPKGQMKLSIVTGVAEMLRTVLILMLLSCLARAAGDDDLSGECTRAAGVASFGPGTLAVGMLLFAAAIIETNAQVSTFTTILFTTVRMGTYAILAGTIFPAFMAARETADACDEPFQTRIPKL